MIINCGELWNSLESYPNAVTYYDVKNNVQDTIEDHSEMETFFYENDSRKVYEFMVSARDYGFSVYVELED